MERIRSIWTGFTGGPGVTTFYADSAATLLPAVEAFWNAMAGWLPTDVTIQAQPYGDIIDAADGALTGSWTGTAVGSDTGTGSGVYAAPSGMIVDWDTGTVMDRHRLRGRTFIVPMWYGTYDTDGSPLAGAISDLQGAADALLAAPGNLLVWHRPRAAKAATPYHPAVTARAGGYANVTSATVPDMVAVLRSRRD